MGFKGKSKAICDASLPEISVPQKRQQKHGKGATISSTFEQRFYKLPGDLQVQIIASLAIPDIAHLRIVSRRWYNMISFNETPIARTFLEYNTLPPFAMSLYPLPKPSEMTLHYICGLWHRLTVVSRLATKIADLATRDIFLRKTDAQRRQFLPQRARIRHRLIPLLFTIFHFFETYRHLRLKHLVQNNHDSLRTVRMINPVECKIMNMYDNERLLQVHQISPLFVSSFQRSLRPPSYLGRFERSLRGYATGPPPDNVHAAIFCIGGLKEVARFLDIKGYEARRRAVDEWYTSVSGHPIIHESQITSSIMRLKTSQSQLVASSAANHDPDNKMCASDNGTPLSIWEDGRSYETSPCYGKSLIFNTSLAAGLPMDALPVEHTQLLLSNLPVLQQIWVTTAETLILSRGVVARRQDIKKNGQVLWELIREGVTDGDRLFYGEAAYDVIEGDESLE